MGPIWPDTYFFLILSFYLYYRWTDCFYSPVCVRVTKISRCQESLTHLLSGLFQNSSLSEKEPSLSRYCEGFFLGEAEQYCGNSNTKGFSKQQGYLNPLGP